MNRETSGAVLAISEDDGPSTEGRRNGFSVVVGTLCGFGQDGQASVVFSDSVSDDPLPARSIMPLTQIHVGSQVVLAFEHDDHRQPIIMGVLQDPAVRVEARVANSVPDVEQTGKRETLVLSAEREIVLRCGQSSVTLTRAGKILIRGAYLLSRSSGVNRIKGGSVQIN